MPKEFKNWYLGQNKKSGDDNSGVIKKKEIQDYPSEHVQKWDLDPNLTH
jgi:hypothetical protein